VGLWRTETRSSVVHGLDASKLKSSTWISRRGGGGRGRDGVETLYKSFNAGRKVSYFSDSGKLRIYA